jgi:ubiquitin carboxyl-terminal hydrolase 7
MVLRITGTLVLLISRSRLFTYDDVVERVAEQLGLDDPSKIRLTPHNCYSQQPKPQPIKYRGVEHLSDMLVHYNQVVIDLSFNPS